MTAIDRISDDQYELFISLLGGYAARWPAEQPRLELMLRADSTPRGVEFGGKKFAVLGIDFTDQLATQYTHNLRNATKGEICDMIEIMLTGTRIYCAGLTRSAYNDGVYGGMLAITIEMITLSEWRCICRGLQREVQRQTRLSQRTLSERCTSIAIDVGVIVALMFLIVYMPGTLLSPKF